MRNLASELSRLKVALSSSSWQTTDITPIYTRWLSARPDCGISREGAL